MLPQSILLHHPSIPPLPPQLLRAESSCREVAAVTAIRLKWLGFFFTQKALQKECGTIETGHL